MNHFQSFDLIFGFFQCEAGARITLSCDDVLTQACDSGLYDYLLVAPNWSYENYTLLVFRIICSFKLKLANLYMILVKIKLQTFAFFCLRIRSFNEPQNLLFCSKNFLWNRYSNIYIEIFDRIPFVENINENTPRSVKTMTELTAGW